MALRAMMQLFALAVAVRSTLASLGDVTALLQVQSAAERGAGAAAQQQWPFAFPPAPRQGLAARTAEATKKTGVSFEFDITGERAGDVDADFGGRVCKTTKDERSAASHSSCTIRSGDQSSFTMSSNFVTPLDKGDTFTYQYQNSYSGLPIPLPPLPPVSYTCPVCGAQCDMSLDKVAPGVAAQMASMAPLLGSMGIDMSKNVSAGGLIDMPPCPVYPNATQANQEIPADIFDKTRAQMPAMLAGMVDSVTYTWTSKWSLNHADGSTILEVSSSGTMGKV